MSELPDLPPVVRRTRPVPAGGLEAAMASGSRRRSRMLAVAGGTTTALVLVLAGVLTLPGGSTDSLGVAERPSPAPSPTRSTEQAPQEQEQEQASADTAAPAVPAPPPQEAAPPAPTGPGAAGRPDTTAQGRPPRPATAPAEPTAAPPPPPPAARPAYREDTDEDAPGSAFCSGTTLGGCTSGTNSGRVARRGDQVRISHFDCSGRGVTDTLYFFSGGKEKELVVTRDGQEVFRFSSTVRYVEGAHQRRLRGGRCIEWTGRWDQVTTAGQPVPAGTYEVRLTVEADRAEPEGVPQEGGPYRQTGSFDVTIVD